MKHRNRTLIISGIIWAVLAITFMIVGFAVAGQDILGWFTSKYAMITYVFLIVYAIVVVIFVVLPMINERL